MEEPGYAGFSDAQFAWAERRMLRVAWKDNSLPLHEQDHRIATNEQLFVGTRHVHEIRQFLNLNERQRNHLVIRRLEFKIISTPNGARRRALEKVLYVFKVFPSFPRPSLTFLSFRRR